MHTSAFATPSNLQYPIEEQHSMVILLSWCIPLRGNPINFARKLDATLFPKGKEKRKNFKDTNSLPTF